MKVFAVLLAVLAVSQAQVVSTVGYGSAAGLARLHNLNVAPVAGVAAPVAAVAAPVATRLGYAARAPVAHATVAHAAVPVATRANVLTQHVGHVARPVVTAERHVAHVPVTRVSHQPAVINRAVDVAVPAVARRTVEVTQPQVRRERFQVITTTRVVPAGSEVVDREGATVEQSEPVIHRIATPHVAVSHPVAHVAVANAVPVLRTAVAHASPVLRNAVAHASPVLRTAVAHAAPVLRTDDANAVHDSIVRVHDANPQVLAADLAPVEDEIPADLPVDLPQEDVEVLPEFDPSLPAPGEERVMTRSFIVEHPFETTRRFEVVQPATQTQRVNIQQPTFIPRAHTAHVPVVHQRNVLRHVAQPVVQTRVQQVPAVAHAHVPVATQRVLAARPY